MLCPICKQPVKGDYEGAMVYHFRCLKAEIDADRQKKRECCPKHDAGGCGCDVNSHA